MENIKIGLVQMQAMLGEKESNLNKIEQYVREGAQQGVELIAFPELTVTGYDREKTTIYAEMVPGPSSNRLVEMAKIHKITILAGIVEQSDNDKPYITQLICHSDGTLEKYRKTHLGVSEQKYFSEGNEFLVSDQGKAKFSMQICWELHFPEITTILSKRGAEIIFAPHASPSLIGSRREIWLKYMGARAYDNAVFVASCNLLGTNGGRRDFGGGTLVIGPKGQIVAEDFNGKEGLLIAELDCEEINKIRYAERVSMGDSFYLKYRRPEMYQELLEQ